MLSFRFYCFLLVFPSRIAGIPREWYESFDTESLPIPAVFVLYSPPLLSFLFETLLGESRKSFLSPRLSELFLLASLQLYTQTLPSFLLLSTQSECSITEGANALDPVYFFRFLHSLYTIFIRSFLLLSDEIIRCQHLLWIRNLSAAVQA